MGSTEGSNNNGPRKVVIKLPKAVDIKNFAVASNGSCGDGPEAGVKKFKVETKTANGGWVTAFVGTAPNNGKLLTYVPTRARPTSGPCGSPCCRTTVTSSSWT